MKKLTKDDFAMSLIFNKEANRLIIDFVDLLNKQGVLQLFISGKDVDRFTDIIRAKRILEQTSMSFLDAHSEFIVNDYIAQFRFVAAYNLEAAGISDEKDIFSEVQQLFTHVNDPKNALFLFNILQDWAFKNCTLYEKGIEEFAYRNYAEREELLKSEEFAIAFQKELQDYECMIRMAFPCGVPNEPSEASNWISRHRKMYSNVDFSPLDDYRCFESCYKEITSGGLFRQESYDSLKKRLDDFFERVIMEDVLNVLGDKKKISGSSISKVIAEMANNRPLYVSMKYIQAIILIRTAEKDKMIAHFNNVVASLKPNNYFWNIPS